MSINLNQVTTKAHLHFDTVRHSGVIDAAPKGNHGHVPNPISKMLSRKSTKFSAIRGNAAQDTAP